MMRKLNLPLVALVAMLWLPVSAWAQSKEDVRAQYVVKQLGLKKDVAAQFKPTLLAFLKEVKVAKSGYTSLKDKQKDAIKKGMITNAQADALVKAHFEADRKELAVKQKYYPLFLKTISAKQAYSAFDYANDSMKKISGGNKGSADDE